MNKDQEKMVDRLVEGMKLQHYHSTACYHGQHERCRQECKFCQQRCRCLCHLTAEEMHVERGDIEEEQAP